MSRRDVLRILDASANRAAEGLRTVEEFVRFLCDDPLRIRTVKQLRHDLTAALQEVPVLDRLAARDTSGDRGTQVSADSERVRTAHQDVALAALARVQQSLRCLEEYGKTLSESLGLAMEGLRYRVYTLEKDLMLGLDRQRRLAAARLYVLVDCRGELTSWLDRIETLAVSGTDVIQIRDKQVSDRELLQRSAAAVERLRATSQANACRLIINDRADVAAAVDADGVHVGQDELTVAAARRVVGDRCLIGVSTHHLEQARQAVDEGADYIGCGPTFPSRTKSFDQFPGVAFLAQVAEQITLPAFAIGGVDLQRLDQVFEAGCHRIAVSDAVWAQEDLAAACRRLQKRLAANAPLSEID